MVVVVVLCIKHFVVVFMKSAVSLLIWWVIHNGSWVTFCVGQWVLGHCL